MHHGSGRRAWTILFAVVLAILYAGYLAYSARHAGYDSKEQTSRDATFQSSTFKVAAHPSFGNVREVLARLIAVRGKADEPNTFCVLGQKFPNGDQQAYVYWKEGNAIILWEPVSAGIADLASSRRYWRLDTDVVNDDADVSGSTYIVTQEWVDELITECRNDGEAFQFP